MTATQTRLRYKITNSDRNPHALPYAQPRAKEAHKMISLNPVPCEAARSEAYEQGLRDAVRILAGSELSAEQLRAIVVGGEFGISLGGAMGTRRHIITGTRRQVTSTRRPFTATGKREALPVRRGQTSEAEAARIAETRTERTGSPHEVVELPGGLYGVRRARRQ